MRSAKYVLPLLVLVALGTYVDLWLYQHTYHNNFLANSSNSTAQLKFPLVIGNVTVVKALVGQEGINAIRSLHWHPNAIKGLEDGAVVMYSDGSIAWIAVFRNDSIASKLLNEMISKIKEYQGELPYAVPIPHKVGNMTFYIIPDVRNRVHVLWQEGRYLIWVQMGKQGVNVLNALIKYYWKKP